MSLAHSAVSRVAIRSWPLMVMLALWAGLQPPEFGHAAAQQAPTASGCYAGLGRSYRPPAPPPARQPTQPGAARLRVERSALGAPLRGVGLNLEPTLWRCPAFQPLLDSSLIEPLGLGPVRLSLAQSTWLPPGATNEDLNWQVYQTELSSAAFAPTWEMIAQLNRHGIEPIVMQWGAPGLMTDDGSQFGRLRPEYYVAYAEYYTAAIDYAVRQRGLRLLAASPMNEPDCGDGSKIEPRDYPTVLKLVADRLRPYGVGILAPDTCSAASGEAYLDALLADPTALAEVDLLGVHQYSAGPELAHFIQRVRGAGLSQPVYVPEFTSFGYGNLDGGQDASDELGYTLDVLANMRSHLLAGADAALYWDGVDYLQEHHAAVTRWGLLRGPADDFAPRQRYAAFAQVLPYLGPGARLAQFSLSGESEVQPLAVVAPPAQENRLAIVLINPDGPTSLTLELADAAAGASFELALTDAQHSNETLGTIALSGRWATLLIPERSLVTLVER
jgi:hypothetical protein